MCVTYNSLGLVTGKQIKEQQNKFAQPTVCLYNSDTKLQEYNNKY